MPLPAADVPVQLDRAVVVRAGRALLFSSAVIVIPPVPPLITPAAVPSTSWSAVIVIDSALAGHHLVDHHVAARAADSSVGGRRVTLASSEIVPVVLAGIRQPHAQGGTGQQGQIARSRSDSEMLPVVPLWVACCTSRSRDCRQRVRPLHRSRCPRWCCSYASSVTMLVSISPSRRRADPGGRPQGRQIANQVGGLRPQIVRDGALVVRRQAGSRYRRSWR